MNQQRKKTVNNVQLGIVYQPQPQSHQQQLTKPVFIAKHQAIQPTTASVSTSSQSVSNNFVPTPASIHSSSSSSSSSSCSTTNIDNHRTPNNINNNTNNNSFLSANELNFKNFQLQQALKAATAALQKSKISTIDQTSISITKSNNINNNSKSTTIIKPVMPGNQHSFKPYSKPPSSISTCESPAQYNQQRNTTLIIETQLPQPQSAVTRTANTSDYDNLDQDNIDISVNLVNQNKIHNKNKHQQQETEQLEQQEQETMNGKLHNELPTNNENTSSNEIIISAMLSSSSASSSLSSSSSSASSSLMNTHNNNNISNKQPNSDILLSSRSSTQSSNHANHQHNPNKLDLEDLRLLNESANHHINHEPLLKQNNNNNKLLTNKTKHKSVSIDHLNVTDLELAVCQNSHNDNNNNNNNNNLNLADHLYENCPSSSNNSRGLPPPPHIQPYSGVLSKSLFSVVLKPQPMKPPAAVNTSSLEKTHIIKYQQQHQQQHPKNNLTMKKKCVSTANLKFNEVKNNHLSSFSPANHKSVSFLDSDTLTGRVIAVTEELDEDNEPDNEQEEKAKLQKLQELLALKTAEIKQLKQKLKTTCEQNQIYEREREISADELEEERQIYEQKLCSIRSHFNQQLSFFEQNERQCLQDRVKSLQQSLNDLKCNYQKNLDQDLKHLKQKLTESQMANQQLAKQLQDIQLSSKCNCITSQTTINNKANVKQHELMHILKQIKNENNDLKFQLNAERERFQIEKEKWINEKRKVIQFQTYLQHHNKGELNNNNNNTMVYQSNQGVEHINNNKSPNLSIPIQHQQSQPQSLQSQHQQRLYNNKNNKYIQQNNNNTFL